MNKIIIALLIVLAILIIFSPVFLIASAEITREKDETLWINKGQDNETLKREAMSKIDYDAINARLNLAIITFRVNRGLLDDIERIERDAELYHTLIYMSKFNLPVVSMTSHISYNRKFITPIEIEPIPIPTPVPDNNNGNGLGNGQGNGGNNNGQGNNGQDNGNGNNNGNNGNHNGQNK